MGSGQSKPDTDDFVLTSGVPLQFSQEVVDELVDASAGTAAPSRERQTSIDAHVRARIGAELARLRNEEEEVRAQVEAALARENLDAEQKRAGAPASDAHSASESESASEGEEGESLHSGLLLGDIEEVRGKIDKFHGKSRNEEDPATVAGQALATCYRSNPSTPLDCWREVETFKSAVSKMEKDYIASFQ